MLQGNMLPGNMLPKKCLAVLFTYDTNYSSNKERVNFHRKLYGRINYNKNGPEKKGGLLDDIPFINPTKSCIIVKSEHACKLREFFKRHEVKWSEHTVILKESELKEFV
jgi:hypothetical protein